MFNFWCEFRSWPWLKIFDRSKFKVTRDISPTISEWLLVLFPISILFLFSLTASATSSFHHHVALCLHGPFDSLHVNCAVYFIIFFHLLPVFIYIKVFPLCFCYLIFDHALVFFTFFPPWASIHALLVQTSYAVFFLYWTACPLLTIYALVHILHLEWPWHYEPLLCPPVAQ